MFRRSFESLTLALILSCVPAKSPPMALGTATLVPGTFTTFLVEAQCAADETPEVCDPQTAYPLDLRTRTSLVGTYVPSAAMCGAFRVEVKLDNEVAWAGTVPGGGDENALGTFIIGAAEAGLHVLSITAEAADDCYRGKLDAWSTLR